MAAPTYGTDLTIIDDAEAVGTWAALGGGGSGLADETDYFIQNTQCVSKGGWTAATKGIIHDEVTLNIASGDAMFIWVKQANRNLMDTQTLGGTQVLVGSSASDFDRFYTDGNDSEGSDLAGWRNYAVDPTQTPSTTTGSPTDTTFIGVQWKMLGSGSLKGNPNAIDVSYHGRELTVIDGDVGNGYGTFTGAAAYDAGSVRRWGILTPATGALLFHGAFVIGTASTSADFRDADQNIVVLEDEFVPTAFNEFEIRNASTNVAWDNIIISHLGTTSPSTMTLDVGTFTGNNNKWTGCGTTTFNSSGSNTNSTWTNCDQIILAEADISGSKILLSTVSADTGAVSDARTTTASTAISELDNCEFSQGAAAHHAITFGTGVDDDIILTGIEFTGFDSTADSDGATVQFLATSGSLNLNLVECTVDGVAATVDNVGIDNAAGIGVTIVISPVTETINVKNSNGDNLENARVFVETAATIAGGEIFEAAVTSLSQAAGVATCTTTAVHGLTTGDKVVIRGAQPDEYNKTATVTVTSTTVFTFSIDSATTSPATGTPVVSFVILQGLTNASGIISATRTWGANQVVKGWSRKTTASPFYKEFIIGYTINKDNGNTINTVLQPDE